MNATDPAGPHTSVTGRASPATAPFTTGDTRVARIAVGSAAGSDSAAAVDVMSMAELSERIRRC